MEAHDQHLPAVVEFVTIGGSALCAKAITLRAGLKSTRAAFILQRAMSVLQRADTKLTCVVLPRTFRPGREIRSLPPLCFYQRMRTR
jgi:hypothetical protein